MGLLNTKPEVRVEKEEANPTYQTYGRRGEVDYAVDYRGILVKLVICVVPGH